MHERLMSAPVFRVQRHEANPVAAFAQSNFKVLVGVGLGLLFLFAVLSPRSQGAISWSASTRRNVQRSPRGEERVEKQEQGNWAGKEISSSEVAPETDTREETTQGDSVDPESGQVSKENAPIENVESEGDDVLKESTPDTVDSGEEGVPAIPGNVESVPENVDSGEDGVAENPGNVENTPETVDSGEDGVAENPGNVENTPETVDSGEDGVAENPGNVENTPETADSGEDGVPATPGNVENTPEAVDLGEDGVPGNPGDVAGEDIVDDAESMPSVPLVDNGESSGAVENARPAENLVLAEDEHNEPSKLLEGSSEAELVFAKQERGRTQCLQAIQQRIRRDYKPLFAGRSKIALLDVALHENLGDDILWRGPIKLAADFGQSIDYICMNSQGSWKGAARDFPVCSVEKTVQVVKDGGLVMFHGGGNWGDLYRFVQTKRMAFLVKLTEALKGHDVKVLSLPQSIHYGPGSPSVAKDDAVMNSLPKDYFTLFLRQQDSYEIAKRHYKTIDAKVSPDIAFILGPLRPIGQPEYDILVLIRQDGEIRPEDKNISGAIAQKAKAANVTHRIQDWWYKPHPGEFSLATIGAFSEVRTAEAIKIVSKGKIVVTNRLHATIVATMLGKTLFWVDTVQQKVSRTRSVAFSTSEHCTPENLHAIQASTISEAVDQAIELLKQEEFVHN